MKEKNEKFYPPRKTDALLVYGMRPVIEAMEAGQELDKIYLHRDLKNEQVSQLKKMASERNIPVLQVPNEKMTRLTSKNHQGVVAFMAVVEFASLDHILNGLFEDGKTPLILILDRITDVRNFGAIARTATCTGVHAIVIPARETSQLGPDALKTSAGALHHIPICREHNLKAVGDFLKKAACRSFAVPKKGRIASTRPTTCNQLLS